MQTHTHTHTQAQTRTHMHIHAHTHTDTHHSTHKSQGHRCTYLVKAEHVSFDYNTVHHSWRQFYRVSVCAKLSYTRDSSQTLVQMIHGPREDWALLLSFVQAALWRPSYSEDAEDHMVCSPNSTLLLLHVCGDSAKTARVGRQLVQHDDQQQPVQSSQMSFPVFPSQSKENGCLYKCFRIQYFACTATI